MSNLERIPLYQRHIVLQIIAERSKADCNDGIIPMRGNPKPSGQFLAVDNKIGNKLNLTNMAEDQGKQEEQSQKPSLLESMKKRLSDYTKKYETGTSPAAPYLRKDIPNPMKSTQEINVVKPKEEAQKPPTKRPQ